MVIIIKTANIGLETYLRNEIVYNEIFIRNLAKKLDMGFNPSTRWFLIQNCLTKDELTLTLCSIWQFSFERVEALVIQDSGGKMPFM